MLPSLPVLIIKDEPLVMAGDSDNDGEKAPTVVEEGERRVAITAAEKVCRIIIFFGCLVY